MLGNSRNGLLLWGEGRTLVLTLADNTFWDHDGGAEWQEGQSYARIRAALEAEDAKALRDIFPPTERTPQLLPLGRVVVHFPRGVSLDTARLDIRRGVIDVALRRRGRNAAGRRVRSERNAARVRVTLDRETGAVPLAFSPGLSPESVEAIPAWDVPDKQVFFPAARNSFEQRGYAPPLREADGFAQPLPQDPAAAVAFAGTARGLYAATARGPDAASALAAARQAAAAAAKTGATELLRRAAAFWKDYWRDVPRLSIPNPLLQAVYEFGMYKFGASTAVRGEPLATPAPLQGPWYEDNKLPPWGGDYHFNINAQECHWPAYAGNRLENLLPLFDMIASWEERLRHNARVFTGSENGIMLPHAVDDRGVAMTAAFWSGMMDHASTMWMADMMWQYVRYGGKAGRAFLRKTALPFMKGAFEVFFAMLDREPDGSLALPVGPSPEFRGADLNAWGRNASFELAAGHRLAEDLEAAAALLGEAPDPRWRDVLDHLPKAAIVQTNGLLTNDVPPLADRALPAPPPSPGHERIGLWEGLDLPESHRHHAHLAAIHPFDTIDVDDPAWTRIVDASYQRWIFNGPGCWSGWCLPWASILHTRAGNAAMAELQLEIWERLFTNEGHGTLHHACHCGYTRFVTNGGGALELHHPNVKEDECMQLDASGGATAAILEMLLLDKRGTVFLFRGAPQRWLDVSFDGIRAPGGVLVSAARRGGTVRSVRLHAVSGPTAFRLANPWPDRTAQLFRPGRTPQPLAPDATGALVVRLRANERATLRAGR
ncbi:MAG: glycosyl hydrolase family 95 catalytic domain-containing protein [Kiritimatiellia bacterium]|jgi:alpha-L-fucosidase 2